MAYGDEVRRTDTYVDRTVDNTGYIFPVVALLFILGLGAWFASSYRVAPVATAPSTVERITTAPVVPAPAVPTPAPTTPK